jgi:putative ABC transport system permease protein
VTVRLLPWEYGVRSLGRSPSRLLLGSLGTALVVFLLVAAGGFARGMGRSLRGTAEPGNVILVSAGSEDSVERSEIAATVPGIAEASVPGVRRVLGTAFVSPEVNLALLAAVAAAPDAPRLANFRGVTRTAFLVHPRVRVVEGSAPGPGEVMVGRFAAVRMGVAEGDLAVGKDLLLDGRPWRIAGRFEAPGTVMEAEIWAPLQDLRVASKKEKLSSVVLTVEDPADAGEADLFAKRRLDLELTAIPEAVYFGSVEAFYRPVRIVVWTTAILVAAGAFLGGITTLYAAFAARARELATLQVLGFSRAAILLGLVQESLLLASAGSLAGAAAGAILLDGVAVRITMGAFGLAVDAPVLAGGLGAGLLLGVLGVIPPAWRCLRMPVAEALKAVY